MIRLLPSLAISRKQLDEFIEALQEAIAELKKPEVAIVIEEVHDADTGSN